LLTPLTGFYWRTSLAFPTTQVLNAGAMRFRPTMEDIKSKYYREMKKFINKPTKFVPLGSENIYVAMVDSNPTGLLTVYRKAEEMFSQLRKAVMPFEEWAVVGNMNIEAFIEEHVTEAADFEANFKEVPSCCRACCVPSLRNMV
jgi:dynein cytoplasmic 2 heavy chain